MKRGRRGEEEAKRGLASNRWCSSAEEERWWEGADGDGRFREGHSVRNKLTEPQVWASVDVGGRNLEEQV